MKAVLLSIRPEWCKKILSGEKTVEVRRTCPVHGTPFKAYIYCTLTASKAFVSDDRNWDVSAESSRWPDKRGRVIGEFICKKMTGLTHVGETGSWEPAHLHVMAPGLYYKPADEILKAACMSKETAEKYLKGRDGFGWYISDLKIYDQPRELREFTGLQSTRFGMRPVEVQRPPQSWCYVEELA
nr:MAG TPA: helix-turn-helix domain-containing protein [Caudoviricetes sp.]